uniref:Uncharacterized protein n=1 Tax=Tanacetum cinerariifolium TaxID=118510 RepID=A0A699GL04_TANCI|nr:hypothetical protein [Tanacetum cinerariifolium]
MIIKKDFEIVKAKGERRSLALKAKKESSDEECLTSGSEDEEYAMANGQGDRKCFRRGDPNHLIGECLKPPKDNNQRAFVGGSWSDSSEEDDEKVKDETRLVAQTSNEIKASSDGGHINIGGPLNVQVSPNGVFGNEVYGSDSKGFGVNPLSNEFRLCNTDEWRSRNHGGRIIIRGYGGAGDLVVHHGL